MSGDVYQNVDPLDDATVERIVGRLEGRADDPTFAAMREAYLDRLAFPAGVRVLEVGCGTRAVVRAILRRMPPDGRIVGIDPSEKLVAAAERLAGDDDRQSYRAVDAGALAAEGQTFDLVVLHTVLSHAEDPERLLEGAARLLVPGGTLAAFDMDNASRSIQGRDQAFSDAMVEAMRGRACANPHVMRRMPALLRRAGLELADTLAHCFAEIGRGSYYLGMADYIARLVAADATMPPDRVETWIAELHAASEDGTFFAAGDYFTFIARRPAGGSLRPLPA